MLHNLLINPQSDCLKNNARQSAPHDAKATGPMCQMFSYAAHSSAITAEKYIRNILYTEMNGEHHVAVMDWSLKKPKI